MAKPRKPIDWIEDATPQEIGEALLAVDEVKAFQVGAYLAERLAPEADRVLESVKRNFEQDPMGTIGRAFLGLSRENRKL